MREHLNDLEPPILEVRDAYKTYDGTKLVLKGLNMTVRRGSIYGLLGSSGCGKSTLLNSIVGLMQLDAGEIRMPSMGKRDIGFMPQEISLHHTMKTEEVFTYYGTMYGMKKQEIEKRVKFLYDLLQLPNRNKLLNTLSGGQQRRLSLAVTLIHNPKLLILDEPTVGVDPVLRQSIWDHLLTMCSENKLTIIITTHYIEETTQAHTVALLREGVLLCEESPTSILTRLNCSYLEDAFLILSKQQTINSINANEDEPVVKFNKLNKVSSPLSKVDKYFCFPRFSAELKKNTFFLLRSIPLLVYLFGLPIASVLLFNFGTGHEPKEMNFGIVNDDVPFNECYSYFHNGDNEVCSLRYLSCRYTEELNKTDMRLILYDSLDKGIDGVRRNKVWGLVHFEENYTRNLAARISDGRFADDEAVNNSLVNVYMDRSNRVIDEIIRRNIRDSFTDFIGNVSNECGWPPGAANIPISFRDPVYGVKVPTFRDYAAPAMVVLILFSMPLVYGVIIIIEEKNSGATGRSLAAGVNILEVLTAHSVIQVGIQFIQTFTTMFTMYYIFQYTFNSPFLSTALLLLQGITGVSLAFVIAIACDSLPGASCACTAWVISSILLGGMIWPQQGIHPILKPISWLMPITLPVESLRGLTQRGWDLSYQTVWLGFVTCVVWTIVFVFITCLIVHKTKAKSFLSKKIT